MGVVLDTSVIVKGLFKPYKGLPKKSMRRL